MRIILCDNDLNTRNTYQATTEKILAKNDVVAGILTFESAIQMMMSVEDSLTPSDIIFLDIHLPKMDGMTAAKKLREDGFSGEIVFLTKSENHWSQAFDLDALQYLVKEKCSRENYERTLLRAVGRASKKKEQMLWLTCAYESRHIFLSEIHFFEVQRHIVTVHYGNNLEFDFYERLGVLENELLSKGFIRIHRSFLVSIGQIVSTDKQWVTLRTGEKLPVGDKYKAELKMRLAKESRLINTSNTSR